MIIISENSFFHLGIRMLVGEIAFNPLCDFIVFDTGRDFFYILDTKDIKNSFFYEPIVMFSYCRRVYLSERGRKSKAETLLSKIKYQVSIRKRREILTVSELRVMKEICQGNSQRRIAERFQVSEKTINNQKMNALRKLNLNKTTKFFIEYLAWLKLWNEYVEYDE